MAKLHIIGSNEAIDANEGTNLLSALQNSQIPISTSCGGQAMCGYCRLTVVGGKTLLNSVNAKEIAHIGNVAKLVDIRLACQAVVIGDGEIELDVPPVVDVVARKRELNRKSMLDKATRRRSSPGQPPDSQPASEQREPKSQHERIEWRPSRLGGPQSDAKQSDAPKSGLANDEDSQRYRRRQ